jgi:hypothetical protein
VWALGSGVAHACQVNFDKDGNAGSYYADGRELIPGRFMYDCVHWQNNIDDGFGTGYTFRKSPRAIGGPPFNIDYSGLPDTLHYQSLALGDSMPLNRTSGFYYTDAGFSQLSQPNRITENIHVLSPRDTVIQLSTLDTLMNVVYPGVEPRAEYPAVTYYHGSDQGAGHILFTPIDLWRLNKTDFISYVDWVVRDLWLIPKNGTPSEFAAPAAALRRVMTAPPSRGAARALIQGGGAKRILAAPGARPKE